VHWAELSNGLSTEWKLTPKTSNKYSKTVRLTMDEHEQWHSNGAWLSDNVTRKYSIMLLI